MHTGEVNTSPPHFKLTPGNGIRKCPPEPPLPRTSRLSQRGRRGHLSGAFKGLAPPPSGFFSWKTPRLGSHHGPLFSPVTSWGPAPLPTRPAWPNSKFCKCQICIDSETVAQPESCPLHLGTCSYFWSLRLHVLVSDSARSSVYMARLSRLNSCFQQLSKQAWLPRGC